MMDVSNLRVPELKAALKERGLKVSGVKRELVARLKDNLSEGKENGNGAYQENTASPLKKQRSPAKQQRSPAKKQRAKASVKTSTASDMKQVRQLGETGKEGTVWLVEGGDEEHALKQFKKGKSQRTLKCEVDMAIRAGEAGVGPKVVEYSLSKLQIVMQKLDRTLIDVVREQQGRLTEKQQLRILEMYGALGKEGIFHNDPNPLNIMEKNGTLFVIDYGMSKEISSNKFEKYGPNPNMVSIHSLLYRATQGLISRGYLREEPAVLLAGYKKYKDSCGYQDSSDKQALHRLEMRKRYGGGSDSGGSSSGSSSASSRRSAKKKATSSAKSTKLALGEKNQVVDVSDEEGDSGQENDSSNSSESGESQSDESQEGEEEEGGGNCVIA
jgi:tRNA A-37 threonylcarbamoyl transferase component Bud32